MRAWLTIWLIPLLASSAALACPAASVRRGSTEVAVAANKQRYLVGEPVELVLTVTNLGPNPVTFRFSDSQRYDLVVTREDGTPVWRWSHDKLFAQVLGTMTLAPGASRIFRDRWDQRDQEGKMVTQGRYVIEGVFPPRRPAGASGPGGHSSPRVTIIILPTSR
jgi:uncharacterized protein (DUF58 family)